MQTVPVAPPLAKLVEEEGDRLVRRWAQLVESETSDRAEVPRKALREPLARRLDELVNLLKQHGAEAPRLFAEAARPHGRLRFEQRFSPGDVVREQQALGALLFSAWARKYGSIPVEVALLVSDLVAAGASGAVEDYVRRLRAGRARLREAGAIESIVSHLAEGLVAVERDGTVSFVTPPVARILGVPAVELVGRKQEELASIVMRLDLRDENRRPLPPDELPFVVALKSGKASPVRWLRLRRPSDAQERVIETDAIPFYEAGELRGVVQAIRDRTEEFRQREALSRAYDSLREMHLTLLRRSRGEALGEVAAGAIGALKNQMNAARLRCRLAVDSGVEAAALAPIESSIDEMADLVSRLQLLLTPRSRAPIERVDLDEVTREALDLVRPELSASARGRGLRVRASLRSNAHVIAARTDLLEVIVLLLLGATDALPAGGTLVVESERAAARARLTVRGATGVSAEDLASTMSGWGATIAIDEGAAVLDLALAAAPAVEERREEPRAAPRREAAAPPARRVLVVDDDPDNREALGAVLEGAGLAVVQAGSFAEAREAAADASVDAALVDVAMPDGNGRDLAAELLARRPDLRVALVTGYEPGGEAAEEGMPLFTKPVDVPRLLGFLGGDR